MKCSLCKNNDITKYTYDKKRDEMTCCCGCVAKGWFNTDNATFDNDKTVVYETHEDRSTKKQFFKLMAKAFPKEERDRLRKKRIKDICFKVDASVVVKNRAYMLYEEFRDELVKIRPIKTMLIGCVIVASRSCNGCFVPMHKFRNMYILEDINRVIKEICTTIDLNQKQFTLAAVPYVVSQLYLPFRFQKVLISNFEKLSIAKPSISPNVRLGISACKLLKDNKMKIDVEYVSTLVDCTPSGIYSFIEKNKKRLLKR